MVRAYRRCGDEVAGAEEEDEVHVDHCMNYLGEEPVYFATAMLSSLLPCQARDAAHADVDCRAAWLLALLLTLAAITSLCKSLVVEYQADGECSGGQSTIQRM